MAVNPFSLLISAAFTAASYFLRPSQNVERGRVREVPIQQSSYGDMIPRFWGTIRVSGNIVWSTGLRQVSETESAKGLGGPKVTTFTYFTDLAIMLSENQVIDLLRIWADGKVIYDKTTASATVPASEGLEFRLYTGSDDQDPDPLIQSDVDGKYGTGSTPAYRGRAYIVFENFNLTDYGNRIPNLSFELVSDPEDGTAPAPLEVFVSPDPNPLGTNSQFFRNIDTAQSKLFVFDNVPGEYTTAIYDLDTLSIVGYGSNSVSDQHLNPHNGLGYNERGEVLFGLGQGTGVGFEARVHKIDAVTFVELNEGLHDLRKVESGGACASNSIAAWDAYVTISNNSVSSRGIYIMDTDVQPIIQTGTGTNLGDISIGETIGAGSHIRTPIVGTGPNGKHVYTILGDDDPPNYNTYLLYAVGVNTDDVGMGAFTDIATQNPVNPLPVSLKHGVRDTLVPADFGLSEFGPTNTGKNIAMAYDRTTQALVIFVEDASGNIRCGKWTRDSGIVSVITVPFMPADYAAARSVCNGYYAWAGTNNGDNTRLRVCLLNIADFTLDETINGTSSAELLCTDWGLGDFQNGLNLIWDSARFSLYGQEAFSSDIYRISLASGEQLGVTLANIVEDISNAAGLQSFEDIDVSELADTTVEGYILANQQSARDAVQPLSDLYFFDGVESDYKLRFLDRGRSVVATLEEDKMVVSGEDERSYTQTRVQESEIPTSVQFTYLDNLNHYQRGAQQSARVLVPRPTVRSDNQQTIDVPVATNADTAKQACEKTLFTRWNEREGFEMKFSWENLALDPADVITVNLNNGRNVRLRVEEDDLGADLSIELRTVQEAANQYVSTASGQTGVGIQTTVSVPKPSELFLLDVPFLRDTDDPGSPVPLIYWAGSRSTDSAWPGGVLYEAEDLANFFSVGASSNAAPWGRLTEDLAPAQGVFGWDRVNTLELSVARGESSFTSASEIDVLNGANALAIINSSTGEVEIVQFANVSVIASNRLSLSTLIRGRRGTDPFSRTTWAAGSLVVLLDPTTLRTYTDTLAEVNSPHAYKLVTVGRSIEVTTEKLQTPNGRSLRPYAPVGQTATINGADIDLAAVRRTRIGGELADGTGTVPLNEDSEEYELEILNAAGDTVLRTITGLTTPAYKYLAADITTDFGSMPATLNVVWYQISAYVGRGFSGPATVKVQ